MTRPSRVAGALARATSRLFAHFGEGAVLRGEPCEVITTAGVELIGEHGVVEQVVTTATFHRADNPRPGDALQTHDGKHWTLDFPLERARGDVVEWVLRPAP